MLAGLGLTQVPGKLIFGFGWLTVAGAGCGDHRRLSAILPVAPIGGPKSGPRSP